MAILFVAGCQKEAIQLPENNSKEITAAKGSSSGGCRMTMYDYYVSFDDYHQIENITYKNGLVDEWTNFNGYTYKMEYDVKKKLKISRAYDGETILYTIHFIYKNNKVIKEIWYAGDTEDIDDEIFYTYNRRGYMIRGESFNYDFFVTYEYFPDGGLQNWFFYIGGLPYIKGEYTYCDFYKNPFLATPGVDYTFVYTNSGFGAGIGKRWYSSEKFTLYDENGTPSVYYEQDPKKTKWQVGKQNYPLYVEYPLKGGNSPIFNTFEYENCNPGYQHRPIAKNYSGVNKNERHFNHLKTILHGPSKNTLERLKAEKLNKKSN